MKLRPNPRLKTDVENARLKGSLSSPRLSRNSLGPDDMNELIEIIHVRQVPGDPRRRWFSSDDMDLIVWYDDSDAPIGFELCYDKLRSERALRWEPELGYRHTAIDNGESNITPRYKATPILVADGHFDARLVADIFTASSRHISADIAQFVSLKLRLFSSFEKA